MKTIRSMVIVSGDPVSLQRGASELMQALQKEIKAFDLADEITVAMASDLGRHDALPLVVVYPDAVVYGPVQPSQARLLVEEHLYKGRVAEALLAPVRELSGTIAWLRARKGTLPAEQRIVLRRAGLIDPESIDDYILHDGYQALGKALTTMTPAEVIDEITRSGLQGRGGAGFPTGRKWFFVAGAPGQPKYVICNADESEPGTFKDRLILEGDPHSIIEAMVIAAYAVGASEGYIYIRGEYTLAYQRLEKAIQQAEEYGLLGDDIFGTGFHFKIHIHSGAGAYICGEETALLESLEGKRGESRTKPPFPPTYGLEGAPTVINNVETLANATHIIANGAEWYKSIGTGQSKGTKIFSPCGDVQYPGVYEVPFGITLREVIFNMAGGIKSGKKLKAVLMGGPSGVLVGPDALDRKLCAEDLNPGAGALIVLDEDKCIVDLMQNCAQFFYHESCGQCVPCREGTKRILEVFNWWTAGAGSEEDIRLIDQLAGAMALTSKCGLGQFAAVAFKSSLPLFMEEYKAHLKDKVCPTGVCAMDKVQEEVA